MRDGDIDYSRYTLRELEEAGLVRRGYGAIAVADAGALRRLALH